MLFFKKKKVVKKSLLKKYPCQCHLRNALYLIDINKPNLAYEEICYAIMKSGGELTPWEMKIFNELVNKKGNKNAIRSL